MAKPTMTDYVHIIFTLFDLFVQQYQLNRSMNKLSEASFLSGKSAFGTLANSNL